MNPILSLAIFGAAVLAAFAVVYYIVHHKLQFTNLGRISAFVTLAAGTLLDQLNALPWGTILSDAEAKLVGFAIALSMAVLHVVDTVKSTNPPPSA